MNGLVTGPGVVVFGGTFDPVHRGHVDAARDARLALGIADFRLLPAGDPPHRSHTGAPAEDRLAMLALAIKGEEGLGIDRSELDRPGPSYMVDTLTALRPEAGEHPLVLVVGQDAANGLDQWHRWTELLHLAHLVVVTRPGEQPRYAGTLAQVLDEARVADPQALQRAPAGYTLDLPIAENDISSTELRARLRAGEDVSAWLSEGVRAHIRRRGLYR